MHLAHPASKGTFVAHSAITLVTNKTNVNNRQDLFAVMSEHPLPKIQFTSLQDFLNPTFFFTIGKRLNNTQVLLNMKHH